MSLQVNMVRRQGIHYLTYGRLDVPHAGKAAWISRTQDEGLPGLTLKASRFLRKEGEKSHINKLSVVSPQDLVKLLKADQVYVHNSVQVLQDLAGIEMYTHLYGDAIDGIPVIICVGGNHYEVEMRLSGYKGGLEISSEVFTGELTPSVVRELDLMIDVSLAKKIVHMAKCGVEKVEIQINPKTQEKSYSMLDKDGSEVDWVDLEFFYQR